MGDGGVTQSFISHPHGLPAVQPPPHGSLQPHSQPTPPPGGGGSRVGTPPRLKNLGDNEVFGVLCHPSTPKKLFSSKKGVRYVQKNEYPPPWALHPHSRGGPVWVPAFPRTSSIPFLGSGGGVPVVPLAGHPLPAPKMGGTGRTCPPPTPNLHPHPTLPPSPDAARIPPSHWQNREVFPFLPLPSQLLGYLFFPFFFFFSSFFSPSSGGCLLFPSWLGGSQSHQPQAATRHRRVPPRSHRHPPSFPLGSAPPGLSVLPSLPFPDPAAPPASPSIPAAPRHGQVRASPAP